MAVLGLWRFWVSGGFWFLTDFVVISCFVFVAVVGFFRFFVLKRFRALGGCWDRKAAGAQEFSAFAQGFRETTHQNFEAGAHEIPAGPEELWLLAHKNLTGQELRRPAHKNANSLTPIGRDDRMISGPIGFFAFC